MPGDFTIQLTEFNRVLASHKAPTNQEEAICLTADVLLHALQPAWLLFYLNTPDGVNPLSLLPCPTRQLLPRAFIYDDQAGETRPCACKTVSLYCTPIELVTKPPQGFLFLQAANQALEQWEQRLVDLSATHLAHVLQILGQVFVFEQAKEQIRLDKVNHKLWVSDLSIALTPGELALLELLTQKPGHIYSRAQICRKVYPQQQILPDDRQARLDTLVAKLRRKLKRLPHNPITIRSARGRGYYLEVN